MTGRQDEAPPRRTRANGQQSRARILDAATDIAAERGYEATTMSLVSKRSGLPATSIYWHFANKDDLIAAVIERSYQRWIEALDLPTGAEVANRSADIGAQVAKALLDAPEFLRLGLKLAMERRPVEPRARREFLQIRRTTVAQFAGIIESLAPQLPKPKVMLLATYAVAGADGLFIAREIDDETDFTALLELHAQLVFNSAVAFLGEAKSV